MALEQADLVMPWFRQEIAALETGYRMGRILVIREALPGPRGVLGGEQVLLHRARAPGR